MNNDGTVFTMTYNWAKGWYNVTNLFSMFFAAKEHQVLVKDYHKMKLHAAAVFDKYVFNKVK